MRCIRELAMVCNICVDTYFYLYIHHIRSWYRGSIHATLVINSNVTVADRFVVVEEAIIHDVMCAACHIQHRRAICSSHAKRFLVLTSSCSDVFLNVLSYYCADQKTRTEMTCECSLNICLFIAKTRRPSHKRYCDRIRNSIKIGSALV